ncbi:protein EMBRYONIC FLOWER 1 isoform X2 [Iris pallida]|uniref:Protein EMBRYONIC FLOWER 1 isoform X2 n=1 Tax=Iris pallida TaxID=29817 RepID=A0AAX6DKX5_IRIPA|nr:protein EMBRYONIC FLOWER 1 isoform X2 [Iris pallida]
MKLCWPLFKLHDCASDEQPNLAPPLFVKKFKRSNCQNCLHEISDYETAIENGMTRNIQNYLVRNDYPSSIGNNTVEAQPPTTKTIASLPHQSDERVVEKDSSIPGSNGECRGPQVNDLQSSDFIKEGISIPRDDQDKCHKDKKCMSPAIIVAREGEPFQEGNITVKSNTSEDAIFHKKKIDIVLPSKWKNTELIHGFGDTELSNKVIASSSFTVLLPDQKDDHVISETMKLKDLCKNVVKDFRMHWKDNAIKPSHHDRDIHEVTDADTDFTDARIHTQDDVVNPAGSVDRQQNKRGPKLRSLNDIFRSEEMGKAGKFGISSGGAGTNDNDNDEKSSIGRGNSGVDGNYSGKSSKSKSKYEDETTDYRSDLVTQKAESKPNRKKTIPSDGYGRCLIHWLKRVPRKAKSHKGDAQGKHIDNEVDKCRSAVVRDLDLNREYCGEEDEQEIIGVESNLMTDVEIIQPPCMTKEDELPLKGHMIIQQQPAYASHSTSPHSKLSVVAEFKDIHHGRKTQERGDKKMSLSNMKNKRPRTENGIPSQTQWLKRNGFQQHKKGTKKQITTWTSEQQDDDIPMDIVELLAKNQHERQLMNGMTDNGSTRNLSVMTEGMKEGNRCSMADYGSNHNLPMMTGMTKDVNMWSIGGAHGKMISDEMHWRISPEESQSNFKEYNNRMAVGNDREVECEPKSYHSYSMSKQNHYIDLNQEAPISASIDYPVSSQSIGLPVSTDQTTNKNFYPQNVYLNRMEMLALCSDHINHTTPGHNFSSFHDGSSILVNGTPCIRNFDLNFNSDDLYPRGTPKAVAHNADCQMMIDLSGKHLQNYKAKDESSINEGRTSAAKPCAVSINGHNSKMMDPVDLGTSETISALNLLRLMDQAACSGEPRCSSIHNIRSTQLGQGNELLRSDVGVGSSEAAKLPGIVDKPDQDQKPRNSGIPFRPVARVGVLGPLLQKEIATGSSNSKPQFGFQASSEHSSQKTNAMGKGEAFHSATVTKTMNAQTSISRDVSSKEVGYSIGSLENTGCSVTGNDMVQHATNNKNDTLQPIRSTCKTEVCVLNRNPADFAMPDEDSEYMIGYKEHRRKYTPRSRNLQSPSHLKGKKRQRVMKVNNLKG